MQPLNMKKKYRISDVLKKCIEFVMFGLQYTIFIKLNAIF